MTAEATVLRMPFALGVTARRSPKRPMDEARFEVFYRKTAGQIWSYIFRLTDNAAIADDLLQTTFFRFLRGRPEIADEKHLRHYIFRTATNLVLDHFRQRKRHREEPIEAAPEITQHADRGDLRHDMMRIFAELKPQERALLWLAHVEGCSHEEIAEAIGVRPKSVRVLLFRARKHLADFLTREGLAP